MAGPENLKIVEETDIDKIAEILAAESTGGFHVTNGAYAPPAEVVRDTTLAGFQFIRDQRASLKDTFMIAVNSNKSMADFAPGKETEDQYDRAMKVAGLLARQNQDRKVIVVFYDQETPQELYNRLAGTEGVRLKTLHKWGGYGIGKDAPVIEGAEYFEEVFAFPYFDPEAKPVFYDNTRTGDQTDIVQVVSLHHTQGRHGDTYLKPDKTNTPLF